MKRKIFAALAISAIAFVSCKKDEPVAPAEPGTATISGTLWANTNVDNDTDVNGNAMANPEYAPSGVRVTAVIDAMDLDQTPDADFDYQDMSWSTVTGTNGSYSFTGIPCYATAIDCELRFNDFTADQQVGGDDTPTNFTLGSVTVSVYAGAVVINDYEYND